MLSNEEELRWFIIHRLTITRLLGKWGDSRAIPMLRQAFRNCQEQLDQGNYPNEIIYEVNQSLSFFQRLLTETINILSSI
jgi:hypothetical protein